MAVVSLVREELEKRFGRRERFSGTFKRFGSKTGYEGRIEKTVLLVDIKDKDGRTVSDHLWFRLTKGFEVLNLQVGDTVTFDARVSDYVKGYVRESEFIDERTVDYKLNYPTKIQKLTPTIAAPLEQYPKEKWGSNLR